MQNFYKPSGKCSSLFFFYQILAFLVIIPIFSFLQATVFWYAPQQLACTMAAIICLASVVYFCGHWCITMGKVRNKNIAVVSAVLSGLAYIYISSVFYCAFAENRLHLEGIAELCANPAYLWDRAGNIMPQGLAYKTQHMRAPAVKVFKNILAGLWGFWCVFTQFVFVAYYYFSSVEPFVEKRDRWAKEIILEFGYVKNKADFINKMRIGDLDYIARFPLVKGVNVSHSKFEIYPMEDNYCLTVHNQRAKEADNDGEVDFKEDTLFEYLLISKQAGDMLLAKQIKHKPGHVSAKIVSKRIKRNERLVLLREAGFGALPFYLLYLAFSTGQVVPTDAAASALVFSLVFCVVYYGVCAITSFIKEDVIVLEDSVDEEDWEAQEISTNLYRVEQKDSGMLHKTFYSLMFVVSTGFLVYTINFVF